MRLMAGLQDTVDGLCRKERGHKMWQFVDEIRKREAAKRGSANA